jgi:hypothetical protein
MAALMYPQHGWNSITLTAASLPCIFIGQGSKLKAYSTFITQNIYEELREQ